MTGSESMHAAVGKFLVVTPTIHRAASYMTSAKMLNTKVHDGKETFKGRVQQECRWYINGIN